MQLHTNLVGIVGRRIPAVVIIVLIVVRGRVVLNDKSWLSHCGFNKLGVPGRNFGGWSKIANMTILQQQSMGANLQRCLKLGT